MFWKIFKMFKLIPFKKVFFFKKTPENRICLQYLILSVHWLHQGHTSVSSGLALVVMACKARRNSSGCGGFTGTGVASLALKSGPNKSAKKPDRWAIKTLGCTGITSSSTEIFRSLSQQTSNSNTPNIDDGGCNVMAKASEVMAFFQMQSADWAPASVQALAKKELQSQRRAKWHSKKVRNTMTYGDRRWHSDTFPLAHQFTHMSTHCAPAKGRRFGVPLR